MIQPKRMRFIAEYVDVYHTNIFTQAGSLRVCIISRERYI